MNESDVSGSIAARGDFSPRERGDGLVEGNTFDQTVKALGAGASRRSIMRGLAAALAAAAGGGIATTALAKNKSPRKAKKRKKNARPQTSQTPPTPPTPQTCARGTSIKFLVVPADGSVVFTPVLKDGRRYLLRASGFWATNGNDFMDAVAAFPAANPFQPVLINGGVRLGLSVDNNSPEIWGAYRLDHTYEMEMVGTGKALALRCQDSVYTDNSRLLNFEILCG